MMRKSLLLMLLALSGRDAWAAGGAVHSDPIAPVILGVTGILLFALAGRYGARKLGQPSVLGELVMGVIIGNVLYYFGFDFIVVLREGTAVFDMLGRMLDGVPLTEAARQSIGQPAYHQVLAALDGPHGGDLLQVAQTVDVFSRYGVIFLLFLVGLETSVDEMRSVGFDSLRVALLGVAAPFLLGFYAARLLMPELSVNVDLFVAATLGATSVGITARVLQDMGWLRSRVAHVILGAAVIDDVLGLVMLAIVSGIVVSGGVELGGIVHVVVLSAVFLVGAFVLGPYFLSGTIWLLRRLDIVEAKIFISFLFVMVLAWLANLAGLATIVGAFTAGLILHDAYFKHWGNHEEHRFRIKDLIAPLEAILVPIFFVLMGIQVKLETFLDWHVIAMAGGLLVAAVAGKIVSGLGAGRDCNRLAVGLGMMPRGEVGLIFASIGKSLGVISASLFSAVVLMVIVTTVLTPPLLKWALRGGDCEPGLRRKAQRGVEPDNVDGS
ncbi:MAG TPA: cation:proton antiporter [Gammaproteobacteria bacterium]|nr:cation:proton antiporter [Gammaproteobacteria bacterium]